MNERYGGFFYLHGIRLGLVTQAHIAEQVLKGSVSDTTQFHGFEQGAQHALKGGTHIIEARRVDDEPKLSARCSNAGISLARSVSIVAILTT